MNYKLKFLLSALKEWKKLDHSIQAQLKKKLNKLLNSPHVSANRLRGFENHFKIKLRASGYRLVYEVIENEIYVLVIAIGKRENGKVYNQAKKRAS